MEFPQYRKKFNNQSLYKITSFNDFEEIQLIGKRFFLHKVHADKYFEILQIKDMLDVSTEMYKMSDKNEFESHYKLANEYLASKDSGFKE